MGPWSSTEQICQNTWSHTSRRERSSTSLRKEVEGVGTVVSLLVRRGGGTSVKARGQIVENAVGPASVVKVQQVPNVVDLHLVGAVIGVDGDGARALVTDDGYDGSLREGWLARIVGSLAVSAHAAIGGVSPNRSLAVLRIGRIPESQSYQQPPRNPIFRFPWFGVMVERAFTL